MSSSEEQIVEATGNPWVAATEEEATVRGGWTKMITLNPGVRLFRVTDQLAATALLDWSEPVQLKIQKREDETYELVARTPVARDSVAPPASVPSPPEPARCETCDGDGYTESFNADHSDVVITPCTDCGPGLGDFDG